jgi:hypothetical protein
MKMVTHDLGDCYHGQFRVLMVAAVRLPISLREAHELQWHPAVLGPPQTCAR